MPPRSKRPKNYNENDSYIIQAAIVIKNNNPRNPGSYILISRRTGFQDVWIGSHHYYQNTIQQTSPQPSIHNNVYEAHYQMTSQQAKDFDLDQAIQEVQNSKPKQTIVITRKKK